MPSSLPVLENLTPCIGKRGQHVALFDQLKQTGVSVADFYQSANTDQPYMVQVDSQGLDLFLICNQAPTQQPEGKDASPIQGGLWDLLGIALHTAASSSSESAWPGDWPKGIDPATLTRTRAAEVFGANPTVAGNLLIFAPDAKGLAVHCQFAKGNGALETLSLYHHGAFELEKVAHPITATAPQQAVPVPVATPLPAPTCRSGEPTPQTGIYEGRLPTWHDKAAYYNTAPGRFCLRQKGEPMLRLGVVPFKDEALVEWTWIKAG
jgi:hypothetical protein